MITSLVYEKWTFERKYIKNFMHFHKTVHSTYLKKIYYIFTNDNYTIILLNVRYMRFNKNQTSV